MTSLSTPEKKAEGLEPSSGLVLSEKSKKFLNSPFRDKFMTPFIIGSNKLKFYGQMFAMSEHSKFFEDSISIFAESDPPYELFSYGVVLERPMTLLWLYMNDLKEDMSKMDLSLTELLHMYRLCNYFGITFTREEQENEEDYITNNILIPSLSKFIFDKDEEAFKSELNQSTLIAMINEFFKNIIEKGFASRKLLTDVQVENIGAQISSLRQRSIKSHVLSNIFNRLKQYPEIGKAVNYIPVVLDDKSQTYAERKALDNKESLGKLNGDWKMISDGVFEGSGMGVYSEIDTDLKVVGWGPDVIELNSDNNAKNLFIAENDLLGDVGDEIIHLSDSGYNVFILNPILV